MKRTLNEMMGLTEAQTPKWPQVINNLKSLGTVAKKLISGAQSQNQAATLNATSSALRILARMLTGTLGLDNGKEIAAHIKKAVELVEKAAKGAPTEGTR